MSLLKIIDMKKTLLIIAGLLIAAFSFNADAQKPKNYEKKTSQLADNLVKSRTYQLRDLLLY